ncbi:asparaginase [Skermanella rosea]|uniref:asparaginase n=1 Tax=Skermanella rosea TaxID=1817965 RepID=UPI0019330711|nr:asparaginase [Skermanella rosea]UEM03032.1 asparaginase [Skermanella rosea]
MSDHHGHACCGQGHTHGQDVSGSLEGHAELGAAETPVLVEVTRGGIVESRHRGIAAVVDAEGHVVAHWGDFEKPIYARSAIKSLQAIPLVESGAAEAFGVSDEELALACASHNGEQRHTRLVAAWLERIGCGPADLECGTHLPYDEETAHALIRAGEAPGTVHNNCSGKHAGMLSTARHKGEPTKGYIRFDHPVQQRILGVLEQMTARDLSAAPWGVDGCGIPTIAIPLGSLALAMARMADPRELPDRRAEAVARIRRAWGTHPYLVGGRGTFDTRMMEATGGEALVKIGAEGVMCAVLPGLGLGIAVKIEDGATRAAGVAMAALLRQCKVLTEARWQELAAVTHPEIANRVGLAVGEVRPAAGWPG